MATIEKGKIIGEFDLSNYNLPIAKAYLLHQVTNGGNSGDKYPSNREYLRIIAITKDNQVIEYGYIYFMLYTTKEGLPISEYIGSKVIEEYRNRGLGDLLMSVYLFYSYDKGFEFTQSTTRQRKLDLLSLMHKYGFRVKEPEKYDNGEKITLVKNNMVVDIFKRTKGGIYYRFKTDKAEEIYRRNNATVAGNYQYLPSQTGGQSIDLENFRNLGWVVPQEEYIGTGKENKKIDENVRNSGLSM